MGDKSLPGNLQQLLTEISRRRVVTGAATLAIATATSPAFSESTNRSTNMPDNVRFSNPDTMQKPPGYSHVVEVTGPGRTVISLVNLASANPARWAPMRANRWR
jgi:hypothetical protein